MAINFPDSPTANVTTHTVNGVTWKWDGTTWLAQGTTGTAGSTYTDSDVDTHLNTSSASSGEILSWNGTDYAWTTDQTGGGGGGGGSGTVTQINTGTGIDGGPITTSGTINLNAASTTNLGGVQVGSGLRVDGSGIINQPSITDFSWTAPSVADNATSQINITGYKAYIVFKITSTVESWIRLYVDDATRDADVGRSEGNDPDPGSGVLCEVRTSGPNQSVILTPAVIGYDNEGTDNFFLSITNRSGTSSNIQVTLTALQIGD